MTKIQTYGVSEVSVVNGVRKTIRAFSAKSRDERDKLVYEIKTRGNLVVWWPE